MRHLVLVPHGPGEHHHPLPAADHAPHGSQADLFPGTWYLTRVDAKYRREYARKPI